MTRNADVPGLQPLRTRVSQRPPSDLYFIQRYCTNGYREVINSLMQSACMHAKKGNRRGITADHIREATVVGMQCDFDVITLG